MAKPKTHYQCQACGAAYPRWQGQCEACGAWNTLTEESPAVAVSPAGKISQKSGLVLAPLREQEAIFTQRTLTGIGELDRVLGGGLTVGSVVLMGGEPGIGKSTLLLQAMINLSAQHEVAYFTGEESLDQIAQRAARLNVPHHQVMAAHTVQLNDVLALLDTPRAPKIVVIDSIQTLHAEQIESAPGTVSQIRYCTHMLANLAKKRGITFFIVGHITKEGTLAGPKVLEHLVDTVLTFEGDRRHHVRLLRASKNRYGATDEIGVFTMTSAGLSEVTNPSSLFLSTDQPPCPGQVVTAIMEGARPLLVDIEVLVCPTPLAIPRRTVVGWDVNRLHMLVAVLEKRLKCQLSNKDIFMNVAGGLKIQEPAADFAVCVALLSSLRDTLVPKGTVVFGEVSLSGTLRPIPHAYTRMREATRLGFTRILAPKQEVEAIDGATYLPCAHLGEVMGVTGDR
jgi:DNA repair protein RadA/Sms